MAGHEIDQDDLAAQRLDDLTANHLLAGIVSTLDEYGRFDAGDEHLRRVFLEHSDEIDGFKRCEYFGTRLHRLDRTTGALEPGHRGIAVEPDNKPVACGACSR